MIRVLIVEDSLTVGMYLEHIFSQQSDMEVIGRVTNGREAVKFCMRDKPDVVTMDIEMPIMNGLEATRKIMSSAAVPIVIVTASRNARETRMTMQALEAGAVTLIEKPRGINQAQSESLVQNLVTTTRLMAGIKVVTRKSYPERRQPELLTVVKTPAPKKRGVQIVAIGVSTGGPAVLKEILADIDKSFPYPVVIVQHIAPGFLAGMVSWLNTSLSANIKIAEQGEKLNAGTIYFAPDEYHLTINKDKSVDLIRNSHSMICPSVARLFGSIRASYGGAALAIILTGMGKDGAQELKQLRDSGAVTIAQSKESALVYGMPGEAVKLDAAEYVLGTEDIKSYLHRMGSRHNCG